MICSNPIQKIDPGRREVNQPSLVWPLRRAAEFSTTCLLACLLALASCSAPRGFVPIEDPGTSTWVDDGSSHSLIRAIEGSISYYRRLPPRARIPFGELSYSPQEMILSHQLFMALWKRVKDPEDFGRLLLERFHVLESFSGERDNLFTGYFEPIIPGGTKPSPGRSTPIYSLPHNLVKIELSRFGANFPRQTLVGRLKDGIVLPYYSRGEIEDGGVLKDVAEPLAYVNQVDLFFLQIQGSGLVRLQDGTELRLNYAASNGHPYRSLGAEMIKRELMTRENVSMQTIRDYLNAHPKAVRPLLNTNPSYTFFRRVEQGPLGNIEVPLTAGRSLALDHRIFPKGGLAYIETEASLFADRATLPMLRFMLIQDTGGAIRGHGRADVFWGKGIKAEWAAGNMNHGGRLLLLAAKKSYLARAAAGSVSLRKDEPQGASSAQ
jgi:membrane-bound lytic murein transglycosylase A